LNTGIANGSKSLYFDGTQLNLENIDILSSADGTFDDLRGDSVDFNRANFDFLAFKEQVVASQYVYDNGITISTPETGEFLNLTNTYAFLLVAKKQKLGQVAHWLLAQDTLDHLHSFKQANTHQSSLMTTEALQQDIGRKKSI